MSEPTPIIHWLDLARHALAQTSETPAADAQVLLAQLLQLPRAWLMAHPDDHLSAGQVRALEAAIQKLEDGVPLPYVIGHWEFYGLELAVTPDTLIPRPETELLVEEAIRVFERISRENGNSDGRILAVDVGTGSGAIAISLAREFPGQRILAVDRSIAAISVARANAARYRLENQISFMVGDLLNAVSGPFHAILANLPYIPSQDLASLAVAQHEPRLALDGGTDGLSLIHRLIEDAPRLMAPHGSLMLELGPDQAAGVTDLARQFLPNPDILIKTDLAGHQRLAIITL